MKVNPPAMAAIFDEVGWSLRFPEAPRLTVAYATPLRGIDAEVVRVACHHLAATSKWLPAPSEIRECIAELAGLVPDTAPWQVEWEAALARARWQQHATLHRDPTTWGDQPPLSDRGMRALRLVGGWQEVLAPGAGAALRAQFRDAYLSSLQHDRAQVLNAPGALAAVSPAQLGQAPAQRQLGSGR